MVKRYRYYMAVMLIAVVVSTLSWKSGLLERVESITYDWRVQALSKHKPVSDEIAMVVVDQYSLDWMEKEQGLGWPWPREVYGAVIEFAKEGGAKGVVFDMLFSEGSFYGSDDDALFARSLQQFPSVGTVAFTNENYGESSWPETLHVSPTDVCGSVEAYRRGVFPVEPIASSFSALGVANAEPDRDGVIRHAVLCHRFDEKMIPSLSLAMHGLLGHDVTVGRSVAAINYKNAPFSYPAFNIASVFQSWVAMQTGGDATLSADVLKDKVVFIGVSAPGLFDNKATPLSENHPGIDIHATIYDNLLNDDFIMQASDLEEMVWLLLLTVATGLMMATSKRGWHFIFPVAGVPILAMALGYAYYWQGVWLMIAPLLVGIGLSVILSGIVGYLQEGRQKRYIKSAFSHYVSPAIVDQLVDSPDSLKLGGEIKELTLFFSDIEGFTSISEKLQPEILIEILHEYLDAMNVIIMEHQGTIDKYIGDAIVAFWNAPVPIDNHQSQGVSAAMACQKKLKELNRSFKERCGVELKTRIGVHTGRVTIGNLGSENHFDYSFIGDAGNLASRIEGVNKVFGTYTLVTQSTREKVESVSFRKIATIKVKGKAVPISVFEPLENGAAAEKYARFDEAVASFESKEYERAKSLFSALAGDDVVASRYLGIIEAIESGELLWDGAIVLQAK